MPRMCGGVGFAPGIGPLWSAGSPACCPAGRTTDVAFTSLVTGMVISDAIGSIGPTSAVSIDPTQAA